MVFRVRPAREAKLGQSDQRPAAVEQPHDQLLAPDRLDGGHPDVELSAVDIDADLAVLRAPALDDVHAGHDLHARGEGRPGSGRKVCHVLQHAVDPKPDPQEVLLRLDVYVRRPVAQPLRDQQVDDLNGRRVRGDARELERHHAVELNLRSGLLQRLRRHLEARMHVMDASEVDEDVRGKGPPACR